MLNSFYGKPDRTLHLSTVVCIGSEERLVECSFELLSLEDGKEVAKHVDIAGISCKETFSSSPLVPSPSPDVNEHLVPHSTMYIILGVVGSTTVIAIIIIFM